MESPILSRRRMLLGVAAFGSVGLLTACGSSTASTSTSAGAGGATGASTAAGARTATSVGTAQSAATTASSSATSAVVATAPLPTATPIVHLATHAGAKGKLRIAYAGGVEELQMRQNQINAWQKTQANWTVDFIQIVGNRYEWLLTQTAGGTEPDVVYMNEQFQIPLFSRGALVDLAPYVAKDKAVDLSKFFQGAVKAANYQGKVVSIPQEVSPIVMYYNLNNWNAAQVPMPADSWSWDDFLSNAQKLTKGSGAAAQYGHHLETWWGGFIPWVRCNGGDIMNTDRTQWTFSSPQSVEAFQWMVDLMWKYHVAPTPQESTSLASIPIFQTGRVATDNAGAWNVDPYNVAKSLKYDVVRMPRKTAQGGTAATLIYGIGKQSKAPDGAWEAIKYMCATKEGQMFVAKATFALPALNDPDLIKTFETANPQPAHASAFVDQASDLELDIFGPAFQEIQTAYTNIFADMWANKVSVQDALKQADQKANNLMKQ